MLDLLISLWSMSMFSLYFSVSNFKLLILINISMVYAFNGFIVAYRIYRWWKDLSKAEGWSAVHFWIWSERRRAAPQGPITARSHAMYSHFPVRIIYEYDDV